MGVRRGAYSINNFWAIKNQIFIQTISIQILQTLLYNNSDQILNMYQAILYFI